MGKQAPPTRAAPSLVRALRVARGALLFATGTSLRQRRRGVPFPCRSGVPIACRLTTRPLSAHRRLGFEGLILPERSVRLQSAVWDQLGFSIGRRQSRWLPFRSANVPEVLDQASSCEGVSELCQVVINSWRRNVEVTTRKIAIQRLVTPE